MCPVKVRFAQKVFWQRLIYLPKILGNLDSGKIEPLFS